MPNNNSRNHRNNPYAFDGIAGRFHHTTAGAAVALAHRTGHPCATAAALWRLAVPDQSHLGRSGPGAGSCSWSLAVPGTRRFVRPAALVRDQPSPDPAAVLRSPAAHPVRAAAADPVDPADQGRGTLPTSVPRRNLPEDFEAHKGEIRAACYARDARVTRNTRWSQLVTIDIIRHDTLAAKQSVASPLAGHATPRPAPRRCQAKTSTCARHRPALTQPPAPGKGSAPGNQPGACPRPAIRKGGTPS